MVLSRNRHQTDTQNCLLSLMLGRFNQSVNLKQWVDSETDATICRAQTIRLDL